ncbi:(2Fe-2S)-binding protein [Pseudomonas multiresinivorans]|uniref:(2Fe-2S)-binding protein n=1 Tax=Pseudomonas multiresinivorans TaxID=95301 RepID=A0A7Z3GSV1_9PSED|nr:(2Fe-2S)-binding protein [Pseudomonas multiresinivorans]QJP11610.1 (2Fe-2S)-binding protein [Pseudomonas multiresinivorans]
MPDLTLDGRPLRVVAGTTVAAALAQGGDGSTRTSVSGQRRAPLCGMGVCQECRVTIDGQRRLACQTLCREGMQVETRP